MTGGAVPSLEVLEVPSPKIKSKFFKLRYGGRTSPGARWLVNCNLQVTRSSSTMYHSVLELSAS